MKKLTRNNLEQMSLELNLLNESEQRRYVGGSNCVHGVDNNTMCPECEGFKPVSFETYLYMDGHNIWPGGWIYGPDGKPSYAPSTIRDVTGQVSSNLCIHGTRPGDECALCHAGAGDQYCGTHGTWYDSREGCEVCGTHTGFVTGVDVPDCDTGGIIVGGNDSGSGDSGNSGSDSGSSHTGSGSGWGPGGNVPDISGVVTDEEENDEDNKGFTGGGDSNKVYSVDYIVDRCTDASFDANAKQALKNALNLLRDIPAGNFLYEKIAVKGEFVHFSIGETQWRTLETGERVQAPAQYANNTITFLSVDNIDYAQLGEEITHAVQRDFYGNAMVDENLNYEFESKIVDRILQGGTPDNWGFKNSEDRDLFQDFCTKFESGNCSDEELVSEYYKFLDKWNQPGYTDQPGCIKEPNFDPLLLRELNKILHHKN